MNPSPGESREQPRFGRELLDVLLARSSRHRGLALVTGALFTATYLGMSYLRVGSFVLFDLSPWWLCLSLAPMAIATKVEDAPRWRRMDLGWALMLSLAGLSILSSLSPTNEKHPVTVNAQRLSRLDRAPIPVAFEQLTVRDRDELRERLGRRGDVFLVFEGYVVVPVSGEYELEILCDESCDLRIDGRELSFRASTEKERVPLTAGVQRFDLSYSLRNGPAQLSLDWNTPALVELVPLDAYVVSSLDSALPKRPERRFAGAMLLLVWSLLASQFVFHLKETLSIRALTVPLVLLTRAASGWYVRVRDRPEASLVVTIASALLIYPFLRDLFFRLTYIPEESYQRPLLTLELLRFLIGPVWATAPELFLALCVSLTIPLVGFRRISWKELETGLPLRFLVCAVVTTLAWSFTTYEPNLYFGPLHLLDRASLVVLAVLTYRHPIFVPWFTMQCLVIAVQFGYPLSTTWTDKRLLFDVLLLFLLFLILRASISRRLLPHHFVYLSMCLLGVRYFSAGVGKMRLGWFAMERLDFLFINSYESGWLRFLDDETVLATARWIEILNTPLVCLTLLSELSAVLLLWNHRLARWLLLSWIALHVGIFAASGILFWKWIVFAAALVWCLSRTPAADRRLLFSRLGLALSIPLITLGQLYYSHVELAWYDSNVNSSIELEGVGRSGQRYRIGRGYLAPYDIAFAQNRFYFLIREPTLVRTYGAVKEREDVVALAQARSLEEVRTIENERGTIEYDEVQARIFDRFIREYFGRLNAGAPKRRWWAPIAAPHHIWNQTRPPAYREQEPLATVRVFREKSLYQDRRIQRFDRTLVREIVLDPAVRPAMALQE